MVHLPQTFFFLWENYYYHSHLPISPFHCLKFKQNSSCTSRVMRMCSFWTQNGLFPQMIVFFRKPVHEPCFFYLCLSTCQTSKSDINLLVKYWWLNNTEKSHWPRAIFVFNLRTRFFPSMKFSQDVNKPYELWFYTNSRQN